MNSLRSVYRRLLYEATEGRIYSLWEYYVLKIRRDNTCAICFEDFYDNEFFRFQNCQHGGCYDCLHGYIEAQLDNGEVEFACPLSIEDAKLTEEDVRAIMRAANLRLKEKLENRLLRHALNNLAGLMECPTEGCTNIEFSDERLSEVRYRRTFLDRMFRKPYRKYAFKNGQDMRIFTCGECGESFCLLCKRVWTRENFRHDNISCQKHIANLRKLIQLRERAEEQTQRHFTRFSTGRQKRYVTCKNCQAIIERDGGCSHMTCSACSFEFCWKCGNQYPNECHTGCRPLW